MLQGDAVYKCPKKKHLNTETHAPNLPLALRPGSCTYRVPFFPLGKAVSASVGCSGPCDETQVPQALLVGVVCHHLIRVAAGYSLGVLQSLHSSCWLGTVEELLRSQVWFLSASEASPDFCLSLFCFLKDIGKEGACCETCSKKEIEAPFGL